MEYEDYDLLIQGGTIVDPGEGSNSKIDIAIKDGCIVNIQPNISSIKTKQYVSKGFLEPLSERITADLEECYV